MKNIYPLLSAALILISIFFISRGEYGLGTIFMALASVMMSKGQNSESKAQKVFQVILLFGAVVMMGYAMYSDYISKCAA